MEEPENGSQDPKRGAGVPDLEWYGEIDTLIQMAAAAKAAQRTAHTRRGLATAGLDTRTKSGGRGRWDSSNQGWLSVMKITDPTPPQRTEEEAQAKSEEQRSALDASNPKKLLPQVAEFNPLLGDLLIKLRVLCG